MFVNGDRLICGWIPGAVSEIASVWQFEGPAGKLMRMNSGDRPAGEWAGHDEKLLERARNQQIIVVAKINSHGGWKLDKGKENLQIFC